MHCCCIMCMSVSQICLPVWLPAWQSVCLPSYHLSVALSVFLSVCLPVCLSVNQSVSCLFSKSCQSAKYRMHEQRYSRCAARPPTACQLVCLGGFAGSVANPCCVAIISDGGFQTVYTEGKGTTRTTIGTKYTFTVSWNLRAWLRAH